MIKERSIKAKMWKEITPEFYIFESKGQFVEGRLLGFSEINIKGVVVKKWQIERLDNGIIVGFLGGVSLDPMLAAVPVDTTIKLEFDGMVKLEAGHRVKKFKLYIEQAGDDKPSIKEDKTTSKKK